MPGWETRGLENPHITIQTVFPVPTPTTLVVRGLQGVRTADPVRPQDSISSTVCLHPGWSLSESHTCPSARVLHPVNLASLTLRGGAEPQGHVLLLP